MKYSQTIFLLIISTLSIAAQDWNKKIDQPTELGHVHWLRDYNEAIAQSKEKSLPIFIFFQEVPGCHTCSTFGKQVMSHPLIVEAIETHFIPLAVYNNKGGKDARILKLYKEPSWNNPVIRIVNSEGEDVVQRHASAYMPAQVVNTIQNALLASNQISPTYLNLLYQELSDNKEEAILSMYCFWTGEREIGSMKGVISTQAGYMNGTEVVKVKYDPSLISYEDLINDSARKKCADKVYTNESNELAIANDNEIPTRGLNKYKVDRQDKYYLSKTDFQYIPMLSIQATKSNALIAKRQSPEELLSPRQLSILALVSNGKIKNENRAKKNFIEEWNKLFN